MAYKDPNKHKEYMKAWHEAHKEYNKDYYQKHKEQIRATSKAWYDSYIEESKAYSKTWRETNIDHYRKYQKNYQKDYNKTDRNSIGITKIAIRVKSNNYLKKYGTKISGYEIHHCFTYREPYKFIYCPRKLHRLIHSYLKQHNIDADTEHYEYIKHLLDDTVIKYNIE